MPDPNTIRYPSASQDLAETAAKWSSRNSPANSAASSRTTPPAKHCMATLSIGELGMPPCLEYSDPQAQASEATTRIPAPPGSTRPEPPRFAGPTKSPKPENPSNSPTTTRKTGRMPLGRSQSSITSQSDTTSTSSAATPEGTVCSAQLTPPLPTKSSRKPVTSAVCQWAAVGRIPVFQRKMG